jgi:RNA polymerase sigma-54 factor
MQVGLLQQQKQNLAITNQLRQAIELLQYSVTDLVEFINEQTLDNPIIELKEPASNVGHLKNEANNLSMIENVSKEDISLQSHLLQQLIDMKITEQEREVVQFIIYSLNDKGYLVDDNQQLSHETNYTVKDMEHAVQIVQSLDPSGIGARSLQECLLLQLQKLSPRNTLAEQIVDHYLQEAANQDWPLVASKLNTSENDVKAAFDIIKQLKPSPASAFSKDVTTYIVPDFYITNHEGKLNVTVNEQIVPDITLNKQYEHLQSKPEVEEYIKIQMQHYRWLRRSIVNRKQTLLAVMENIVTRQTNFFTEKEGDINPMTMKEIANSIGVHESTVSRAIKNKYAQTHTGIIALKSLFTSKIKTTTGKGTSSLVVKKELIDLIATEDKQTPLSDQKIVEFFLGKGITISRRAVTKYRAQLGIPASNVRKRR